MKFIKKFIQYIIKSKVHTWIESQTQLKAKRQSQGSGYKALIIPAINTRVGKEINNHLSFENRILL